MNGVQVWLANNGIGRTEVVEFVALCLVFGFVMWVGTRR